MSTGNVDDIQPPRGMRNVVDLVADYVLLHNSGKLSDGTPILFEDYDQALTVVWPELHKASPEAHLRVAVSIYLELAVKWKFMGLVPEQLKGLKL